MVKQARVHHSFISQEDQNELIEIDPNMLEKIHQAATQICK
jgi:predicted transcriptional regulator of viral defense system